VDSLASNSLGLGMSSAETSLPLASTLILSSTKPINEINLSAKLIAVILKVVSIWKNGLTLTDLSRVLARLPFLVAEGSFLLVSSLADWKKQIAQPSRLGSLDVFRSFGSNYVQSRGKDRSFWYWLVWKSFTQSPYRHHIHLQPVELANVMCYTGLGYTSLRSVRTKAR